MSKEKYDKIGVLAEEIDKVIKWHLGGGSLFTLIVFRPDDGELLGRGGILSNATDDTYLIQLKTSCLALKAAIDEMTSFDKNEVN